MTNHDTLRRIAAARQCLLDPEQTAVAPGLAEPLRTLLDNTPSETPGASAVATMVLHHEHTRATADPATKEPSSQADLLDSLATSFAHGNVPGMTAESEDAAFQFLIALRDDVRAGRVL